MTSSATQSVFNKAIFTLTIGASALLVTSSAKAQTCSEYSHGGGETIRVVVQTCDGPVVAVVPVRYLQQQQQHQVTTYKTATTKRSNRQRARARGFTASSRGSNQAVTELKQTHAPLPYPEKVTNIVQAPIPGYLGDSSDYLGEYK